ncbi:MAG: indole-3-glycerol phosphate synthase TrpC [Parvularcula sp.]|jgi:indole-3-glycerol phosphate synthase|nr:indole-3-glycerol phosphate synthase TrpC [Parvularcula sp.]
MNVLERIIAYKREEVQAARAKTPVAELRAQAAEVRPRGFADNLRRASETGLGIIAEVKKASPSKGVIRENFDPADLARQLEEGGAACLSVLTDVPSFAGHPRNLVLARKETKIPLLRKDFMIDPYQVIEARAWGADAILIIMAALTDDEAQVLRDAAGEEGLDVLVEVHDEAELARGLALEPELLGVNNRNLKTFETDIETTIRLMRSADGVPIVSESGVDGPDAIRHLTAHGCRRFLIGEYLMRAERPSEALRHLLDASRR